MISYLIQTLTILLVIIFQFYSFGYIFIKKLKLKYLDSFLISTILGISLSTSLIFFLAYLGGNYAHLASYLFLLLGIINSKPAISNFKLLLDNIAKNKISFLLIFLFSLIFSSILFLSGIVTQNGTIYQEFTDSVWHLALINRLNISIPPTHPSSFLFELKNYHYFYDLLLANISKNYFIDPSFLYFQIFIPFISLLLGLTGFAFIRKLVGRVESVIFVFFLYFAGSFAYLIPLFLPNNSWGESSFWVSQTFGTLVNPQLTYSFSILFIILILMVNKKIHKSLFINLIIVFLVSSSMGFKSYAFLVFAFLYFVFQIFSLITLKRKSSLMNIFLLSIFTLPFYLALSSGTGFPFFYKPLWFLDTMVESPDRLNLVDWKLREDTYRWLNKPLHVAWIKIKEFLIFFFGNLGVRSLFIFFLLPLFKINKKLIASILLTFIVFSIFPLLFLQNGTVWNSIQFWYYILIFADILVVLSISIIFKKIKNKYFKTAVISILFFLSIPAFIKIYNEKLFHINKEDLTQIELFNLKPNSKVLICPSSDFVYQSSILTAYYNTQSYFSHPGQLAILNYDHKEMEEKLKSKINNINPEEFKVFIEDQKIDYIICGNNDYKKKIIENISKISKKANQQIGSYQITTFN